MAAPLVTMGVIEAAKRLKLHKVVAVLVVLGIGTVSMASMMMVTGITGIVSPAAAILEECYDRPDPGTVSSPVLDDEQTATAAAILAEGRRLGVPDYGLVISIATALQESQIRPLRYGHSSSLGPFQQLKAWGPAEERIDPTISARKFFTGGPQPGQPGLLDIPGWQDMPLTQAAQAVQRSAYPDAYAKHETKARLIVQDLSGGAPLVLAGGGPCDSGAVPVLTGESCGPSGSKAELGLQPFALGVLRCLNGTFGQYISAFYGRGARPANSKSDHPAGRAVDAMVIDWRGAGKARGDEMARYVQERHKEFRVKYLIWDAKIWSPARADEGWRPYRHPSGATDPTSAHLDHIHVSVHGGGVWTPPQTSHPGAKQGEALPRFVVGGYWKSWGDTNPYTLGATDSRYNVVFLSFALGQSDGSLTFNQTVQSDADFKADIKKLQARGTRVIMSIGGQHSHINLRSDAAVNNFMRSMRQFKSEYGIDGIDWDIEGQAIHIGNMEKISRQLKKEYGSAFAVTITPQGHIYEYKELARNLGDQLDMVSIMFYDYPERTPEDRTRSVLSRTDEFINKYGLKPHQIGVGMRVTDEAGNYYGDNNVQGFSLRGTKHTMRAMKQKYPGYRGVFLWTIDYDRRAGNKWLDTVHRP